MSSIIPSPSKGAVSSVTNGNGLTLSSGTLSMGAASSGSAGAMSAADKTKLDAVTGTNTGDVSLDGASSSWLTLVGQVLKLTLVAASDVAQGIVTTAAQTFAGVKTFLAAIVASAGIRLSDGAAATPSMTFDADTGVGIYRWGAVGMGWSTGGVFRGILYGSGSESRYYGPGNPALQLSTTYAKLTTLTQGLTLTSTTTELSAAGGTGASDVINKIGTSTADASVNSNATLFMISTGIGGVEVQRLGVRTNGQASGFSLFGVGTNGEFAINNSVGTVVKWANNSFTLDGSNFTFANQVFGNIFRVGGGGVISMSGTDSSGTPGAATINKPAGKSAIAAGASSVVITNSLVTASSHIVITPHARDATCKELIVVPAAGSFTVSGSANATAALAFSWEVKTLF